MIEIVAFSRAFADAREDRIAAVLRSDVADEFLDENGLADACAAEEAGLAALQIGAQKVDDFNAGLQHLHRRDLFRECRRLSVNGHPLLVFHFAFAVDGFAEHVENAPQRARADRDRDGMSCRDRAVPASQAVSRSERDAAHDAVAQVLRDFHGHFTVRAGDADLFIDVRKFAFKAYVQNRGNDLCDFSDFFHVSLRFTSPHFCLR